MVLVSHFGYFFWSFFWWTGFFSFDCQLPQIFLCSGEGTCGSRSLSPSFSHDLSCPHLGWKHEEVKYRSSSSLVSECLSFNTALQLGRVPVNILIQRFSEPTACPRNLWISSVSWLYSLGVLSLDLVVLRQLYFQDWTEDWHCWCV